MRSASSWKCGRAAGTCWGPCCRVTCRTRLREPVQHGPQQEQALDFLHHAFVLLYCRCWSHGVHLVGCSVMGM
jgi:hypothetical protein